MAFKSIHIHLRLTPKIIKMLYLSLLLVLLYANAIENMLLNSKKVLNAARSEKGRMLMNVVVPGSGTAVGLVDTAISYSKASKSAAPKDDGGKFCGTKWNKLLTELGAVGEIGTDKMIEDKNVPDYAKIIIRQQKAIIKALQAFMQQENQPETQETLPVVRVETDRPERALRRNQTL